MAPPNKLPTRKLAKNGPEISAVGFGMMGLSIAYGAAGSDEERFRVLDRAWELGCTNWDTSDFYGDCEDLIGKWFRLHPERRHDIFLASKFAIKVSVKEDGSYDFSVDSSPESCRAACTLALQRMNVDSIDLYYIHRLDKVTPIEKTMEELSKLKNEGKIKYIGISECSSSALQRAYAVHPVAAVQVEYNPWDIDIENESGTDLLAAARGLGVTVFAYSPLGRGIMTGKYKSKDDFEPTDTRRFYPRYNDENFPKNLKLVEKFQEMAARKGCTSGQLALAWILAQGDDIIPIPGTKKIKYLEENVAAVNVTLTKGEEQDIRKMVNEAGIAGDRFERLGPYSDSAPL
ncbi:Aldo/keto reductase-like protein [Fusarium oxysporum f. sp. albedinis]|nr:Aldo/keto reductase-like protein [Fusarium oxysporum f. sp. albedinis]KAJ0130924.1 Uncharacterized protein HZ326_25984 [Fusarium oxysporum f. sp. albedinis]KAK2469137.1 hypothetical protein H9L39_19235 [Fusarium oxysporum f. sp. albedinis]